MISALLFALLASPVIAYHMGSTRTRAMAMMAAKSKALPFLDRPASLDGSAVGDFGFDPLGLSASFNKDFMAAAEIKHSRVAMLATVGFVFQQYVHIVSSESNPFKAVSDLGLGPNLQVLSFIGVIELATWQKTFFGGSPGMFSHTEDLIFDCIAFKHKNKQVTSDSTRWAK